MATPREDHEPFGEAHESFDESVSDLVSNVSFHRFVRDEPQSIEQERVIKLAWNKLNVFAGDKVLLNRARGEISGGMIAVMGPSGSGKSTLLNALMLRLSPGMSIEGEVTVNNQPVDRNIIKRLVGYVMQDDVASPYLTVKETLQLVCGLRFRHLLSDEERRDRVSEVVNIMSLEHCADNVIGDGLSGGERKRLAVACELLAFPRFLVLDEPTSALDSLDALLLVQTLRRLVELHGITVICTIHQPQYKVFSTFTRLILLARGRIVYDGAIEQVGDFCERKGRPVPPAVNPADQIMDIAAGMEEVDLVLQRQPSLISFTQQEAEESPLSLREFAPRLMQFQILLHRNFIMATRKKKELLIAFVQTIMMAVFIGTVYLNLSNQASKFNIRLAALFFCCTNQGTFGAISSLSVFASERVLALRERNSGIYHAFPYYAAKVTCEVVMRFPFPWLFAVIVYWLLGLEATAEKFFFFAFVMWLTNVAGFSMAMCISTWVRLPDVASLILPLGMEVARLFGAFFVAPADASVGLHWIMRISYIADAYGAIAHNDFDGRVFDCASPCKLPTTGAAQLTKLHLDELSKGEYVASLIAFSVVCQVLTYVGSRFINW